MKDANFDLSPRAAVDRLMRATNLHDVDGIVACFSPGYRNETPAHPAHGFGGREQVRTNWEQILGAVPDLRASVLRSAVDGETIWTEWEMSGIRRDGAAHAMSGVIIFGIADGRVDWARFYLEPVDRGHDDIGTAVRSHVGVPQ